jgi:hypothetical protein
MLDLLGVAEINMRGVGDSSHRRTKESTLRPFRTTVCEEKPSADLLVICARLRREAICGSASDLCYVRS